MDVLSNQPREADLVVLLVGADQELLALIALMLEMAGFRAVPLSVPAQAWARACEVGAHAIVADLRESADEDWAIVRHLQTDRETLDMRLVVIADGKNDAPRDVIWRGASILHWPFPLTELLSILAAP